MTQGYITPNWPVPAHIKAFTTTRRLTETAASGYAAFNLANHSGDNPEQVRQHRQRLCQELDLPHMPIWLNQVHGTEVIELTQNPVRVTMADASYTHLPERVCAILTADCLPILAWDSTSNSVAAIHGGWRGLYAGIIQKTIEMMTQQPENVFIWLGPAISSQNYEVGAEILEQFITLNPIFESAFTPVNDKYRLDIYKIATIQLVGLGVKNIYTENFCTYRQSELFYSYRRDGQHSGRMATLIYRSTARD